MRDLSLLVDSPNGLRSQEEMLALFDKEVDDFSKWLAEKCPDVKARGPLSKPERALIKTYLVQKFTGKIDEDL